MARGLKRVLSDEICPTCLQENPCGCPCSCGNRGNLSLSHCESYCVKRPVGIKDRKVP